MTNPKSDGQSVQRLKIAPAQKFYDSFMYALNHSWQNKEYGSKSRNYFMSKALARNGGPYVVKGSNVRVPGSYQVSEGSLGTVRIEWTNEDVYKTNILCESGTSRAEIINSILAKNPWIPMGSKLTFLYSQRYIDDVDLNFVNGMMQVVLDPNYTGEDDFRILFRTYVVEPGSTEWDVDRPYPSFAIGVTGSDDKNSLLVGAFTGDEEDEISGAAIIISRGDRKDDERSTSYMAVSQFVQDNFYSEVAYLMSIYSYQKGTAISVGDEWYLNTLQAGQIGRVVTRSLTIAGQTLNYLVLVVIAAGVSDEFVITRGKFQALVDTNGNYLTYVLDGENVLVTLNNLSTGTQSIAFTPAMMSLYNGVAAAQSSATVPTTAQHVPAHLLDVPEGIGVVDKVLIGKDGYLFGRVSDSVSPLLYGNADISYNFKATIQDGVVIHIEMNDNEASVYPYQEVEELHALGYANIGEEVFSNIELTAASFIGVKLPTPIVELVEAAGLPLTAPDHPDTPMKIGMVNTGTDNVICVNDSANKITYPLIKSKAAASGEAIQNGDTVYIWGNGGVLSTLVVNAAVQTAILEPFEAGTTLKRSDALKDSDFGWLTADNFDEFGE